MIEAIAVGTISTILGGIGLYRLRLWVEQHDEARMPKRMEREKPAEPVDHVIPKEVLVAAAKPSTVSSFARGRDLSRERKAHRALREHFPAGTHLTIDYDCLKGDWYATDMKGNTVKLSDLEIS